ncbi:MAG: recombinase zinc beta ribbon domain-containing protein [Ruminococcus sp.]
MGYDTDETGKLVINRTQEPIVVRLYQEFLDGKTTDYIKRIFEREGVKNWDGGTKWQSTTLMSMLENEKYKGDALLQKKVIRWISSPRNVHRTKGKFRCFMWRMTTMPSFQSGYGNVYSLKYKRRKKYLEEHGTNSIPTMPESNPFASKIICGDCNKVFARKGWRSSTGVDRKVWQCSERYKVKGVMGCANRHVEEETLIKAYLMAWNALVENREDFHGAVDGTAAEREPSWKVIGQRSS